MKYLLLLTAIVLTLLGIGQIALTVVGRTATGYITKYEQQLLLNNDDSTRNPSRYKVDYQFATNGKRYTGSVTKIYERGIPAKSDGTAQNISVRYLPIWPHVNAEDSGKQTLSGPVMLMVGVLLFVYARPRPPSVKD